MELKDILKDAKQFPDNHVLTLGNGQTYTLGMLRSLDADSQKQLSAREAEIATKASALEAKFKELSAAQATTAQLYAEAQKQLEEAKGLKAASAAAAPADDPLARLENDNILGPLVKYNKALEAKLKETQTQFSQVLDGVKKMGEAYVNDRLMDAYGRVVPQDKRDKVTIEALIQAGLAKGYKTSSGYVDIERAYADIAAPDNLAAATKAADEAGYKRAMEEMQAKGIVVHAPTGGMSSNLIGVPGTHEPSPFKTMDEAFAAAAKDTNLWRQFNGLETQN